MFDSISNTHIACHFMMNEAMVACVFKMRRYKLYDRLGRQLVLCNVSEIVARKRSECRLNDDIDENHFFF